MARLTHWEGEPIAVWAELWELNGALGEVPPTFEVHDELGSTSDRLREMAERGAGSFSVVIAESQSAGRGRRGATWHSPSGSGLWMSVLLPARSPSVSYVPLLVGLATAGAVDNSVPGAEAGLEWPNDVIVRGTKVAGVLCEAGDGGRVVAGIGVNVRTPPGGFAPDIAERAGSLEALLGCSVSRASLASEVLRGLRRLAAARLGNVLPEPLLDDLNRRDVLAGRRVRTEQEGRGTARGIARSGALVLERPDGSRVHVVAGSMGLE